MPEEIKVPVLCSPVRILRENAPLPTDLQVIDFAAMPCTICGSHAIVGMANRRTEFRCAEHLSL